MEARIFSSDTINNYKNCLYPKEIVVSDIESAKLAFSHDYVCAKYQNNYRSIENFRRAWLLPLEIDNDFTDDEKKWITPEMIKKFFKGVKFIIHYSRNHMKAKNGKKPRPKFHVIFLMNEITDEKVYAALKRKVYEMFPYFDENALDSARYFNGTADPEVEIYEGTKTIDEFVAEEERAIEVLLDDSIPEGKRNNTMLQIAVRALKRDGKSDETRKLYLKESERCNPPLEADELDTIWSQALKYYERIKAQPDYVPPADYNKEEWDEPISLEDVDLPPFPIDALPEALRNYAKDIAETTQTPVDMAGIATLAILAIAMQPRYKVVGKEDWEEQVSLYCMIVAEPSDRKSAVFNQLLKVIHAFEANYNEKHAADFAKSELEHSMLESKAKKVAKAFDEGNATKEEYDEAFLKLQSHKVLKPISLSLDDITGEALSDSMQEQDGCSSIVSSEGGLFDIIGGLYSEGNSNIDIFLKSYSGDSLKVNRIKRGSIFIKEPKLTILLAVQPNVLENMINNKNFEGRGLSARFLYSIPKSLIGTRRFETTPIDYNNKQKFCNLINTILNEPKEYIKFISLSNDAYLLLKDYYEKFEIRLAKELKDIGSWAGKLVGNILRISALITRGNDTKYDPFTNEVTTGVEGEYIVQKADMESAIAVGNYFLEHAKFAFSTMGDNTTKKHAIVFMERLKAKMLETFSSRDAMRMYSPLSKRTHCDEVMNLLCDYGYLHEVGATNKTPNACITYKVNPKVYCDREEPP